MIMMNCRDIGNEIESSIDAVMWDEEEGAWFDFDTLAHEQREDDGAAIYDVHNILYSFEPFHVFKCNIRYWFH